MKIIIDGFGGDLAPKAPLEGAALAVRELGVEMIVTGDAEALAACAREHHISLDGISFADAPDIIPVSAEPTAILKDYQNSSMARGLAMVKNGEGDAFVSAGSTGALLVGATFLVGRIRGVRRPALGTLIPMKGRRFYLLIDAGANHDCRPEMLTQFAVMGSVYYRRMMDVEHPRVGLVNIGTEPEKGADLQKAAYPLLAAAEGIDFVGNVEAREIPNGGCDVAVCDGFTGNVVLKLTEGFSQFFNGALKEILMTNAWTKLSALAIKKPFLAFKNSLDYREYGGVPILGVSGPVVKAHGSSDAYTLKNAIRQAKFCVERDIIGEIAAGIRRLKEAPQPQEEDA